MKLFDRVAIIGVGLIGGSIGLGIKKKGLAGEVFGVCRHRGYLQEAIKMGAIDCGFLDPCKAVREADLIILATPIMAIMEIAKVIEPYVREGAIVSDVGSTKLKIVETLEKIFSKKRFFVGVHPLAGSEKRGVHRAKADMFEGAICVVTKTRKTPEYAFKKINQLWKALGADVVELSPSKHDQILSFASHLPHLIADALILSLNKKEISFGAGGLRDTTRIVLSEPLIWKDIFLTNRRELLKAIVRFKSELKNLEFLIARGEEKRLKLLLEKAQAKRAILENSENA